MRKKLNDVLKLTVIVLLILLYTFSQSVFADDSGGNKKKVHLHNGMVDPDYRPSPEELQLIQQQQKDFEAFLDSSGLEEYASKFGGSVNKVHHFNPSQDIRTNNKITPKYWYLRELPLEREWKEPEDAKYDNYCGPGATQVALDARIPADEVPSLDDIGAMEHVNEKIPGVTMDDLAHTLTDILNQHNDNKYYTPVYTPSWNQWDHLYRVEYDMDRWYANISATMTGDMPGWHRDVNHIVAIIGLYDDGDYGIYYKYAETSSQHAGYTQGFVQWAYWGSTSDQSGFFDWYSRNPNMAW